MTDDRVMRILKQVENREISPDEAVRLIEELELADTENEKEDPRDEFAKDAQEVRDDLNETAREVRDELGNAAKEVREELSEAAREVRDGFAEAGNEVREALRQAPALDDIVGGVNSVFTGLGDALRGLISGNWGLLPQHKFCEVREGSFTAQTPQLDFSHHNGKVSICGWDQDTYRMEVEKSVNASSEDEARRRADESIQVTDSPDGLGVKLIGQNANGLGVSVKVSVPSHLRYRVKLRFHNGSVSLTDLRMSDCEMKLHNGKCDLKNVASDDLNMSFHNGKAYFDRIEAGDCTVSMHNGKIDGSALCSKLGAKTHNGKIDLELRARNELDCAIYSHNGNIDLDLERLEDAAYHVEYSYRAGKADARELQESVQEIESVNPRHGVGHTKWIGESPGFASSHRRVSVKCSVHNGAISMGWIK